MIINNTLLSDNTGGRLNEKILEALPYLAKGRKYLKLLAKQYDIIEIENVNISPICINEISVIRREPNKVLIHYMNANYTKFETLFDIVLK